MTAGAGAAIRQERKRRSGSFCRSPACFPVLCIVSGPLSAYAVYPGALARPFATATVYLRMYTDSEKERNGPLRLDEGLNGGGEKLIFSRPLQKSRARRGECRDDGQAALVLVDLDVPAAPALRRCEHAPTAALHWRRPYTLLYRPPYSSALNTFNLLLAPLSSFSSRHRKVFRVRIGQSESKIAHKTQYESLTYEQIGAPRGCRGSTVALDGLVLGDTTRAVRVAQEPSAEAGASGVTRGDWKRPRDVIGGLGDVADVHGDGLVLGYTARAVRAAREPGVEVGMGHRVKLKRTEIRSRCDEHDEHDDVDDEHEIQHVTGDLPK
ncbi:hypothetical protein DFH11DRAFT_1765459 [Phellopilus nigrolimitatus]|nr:hypothetical protein DFH11DRAFT_1765459 [Phellopilus nigrolimitatus]